MRPACPPPENAAPGTGLLQAILAAAGGEIAPQHFLGGPRYDGLCWRFHSAHTGLVLVRLQPLQSPFAPGAALAANQHDSYSAGVGRQTGLGGPLALHLACSTLWSFGVHPLYAVGLGLGPDSLLSDQLPGDAGLSFLSSLPEFLPGARPGVAVIGRPASGRGGPTPIPSLLHPFGRLLAGDRIILTRPCGLTEAALGGSASQQAAACGELAQSDRVGGLLACLEDIHAVRSLADGGLEAGLRSLASTGLAILCDERRPPSLVDGVGHGAESAWLIACAPEVATRVLCLLFQQGLTQARVIARVGQGSSYA